MKARRLPPTAFQVIAANVATNGYAVIPIDPDDRKRPDKRIGNWRKYRFAPGDADEYANCGLGILTGEIVGIDIDVRDADLVQQIEVLAEQRLGKAPRRVGAAPKVLLMYRSAEPFAKLATQSWALNDEASNAPEYKPHKIEVLADGQQFVAYGRHRETGKPYCWNGAGEPRLTPASDLPLVTVAQVRRFITDANSLLSEVARPYKSVANDFGAGRPNQSESAHRLVADDFDELLSALAAIPNDFDDRQDWIKVLAAFHTACGHRASSPIAEAAAMAFCEKWPGHSRTNSLKAWRSFASAARDPRDKAGAATIFHLAKRAGWSRPTDKSGNDSSESWTPPLVHTYGEGFDPASIPLRQWLLGRRRSRGEVTIDVGPPGVNKSSLLVTDAMAIVTGRPLLDDEVHEQGDVLIFVGEDARRDVEARIAAILQRHEIESSAMGDRLHVVYLSEVDPFAYTLAHMIHSVAVINRALLDWVAEFPNLVAVFIDPIAAWHHVMENDTGAMKVLATELRRVAVRSNIHIGFDHHTTKASQIDPESHVGNTIAMRGAFLAGDARWMFTMAKLKAETATKFGIADEERWLWRRLDPLKASYGPDSGDTRLLKIDTVTIANGETVAVLTEHDVSELRHLAADQQAEEAAYRRVTLIDALLSMLDQKRPRSLNDAACWLRQNHPEMYVYRGFPLSEKRLGDRLRNDIGAGLVTTWRERTAWIVCESSGESHATRWVVDITYKERE